MSDLFRNEVADAQRLDWVGPMHIAGARISKIYGAAAVGLIFLATILCACVPYTSTAELNGTVAFSFPPEPILSPFRGRVVEVMAHEGEFVDDGQPLARISRATDADLSAAIVIRAPHPGTLMEAPGIAGLSSDAGQRLFLLQNKGSQLTLGVPIDRRLLSYVRPGLQFPVRMDGETSANPPQMTGTVSTVVPNPNDKARPYVLVLTINDLHSTGAQAIYPLALGERASAVMPLETRSLLGWLMTAIAG